jgi:hypothetical protein
MQFYCWIFRLSLLSLFLTCLPSQAVDTTVFNFNFLTDNNHWIGDFADYPAGDESFYQLAWGWQNLPTPLPLANTALTKGMLLSGDNRSDDLFMFIKRQVKGLKPLTTYLINFAVTIENNVPPGTFGIGGSPGESVYFKVGASSVEPKKVNQEGFYLLNVDKGEQSQGGKNALVIGDLANPLVDPLNPLYEPKEMVSPASLEVQSDAKGRLWLFVGTDSGYEGSTNYYVAEVKITLEALITNKVSSKEIIKIKSRNSHQKFKKYLNCHKQNCKKRFLLHKS